MPRYAVVMVEVQVCLGKPHNKSRPNSRFGSNGPTEPTQRYVAFMLRIGHAISIGSVTSARTVHVYYARESCGPWTELSSIARPLAHAYKWRAAARLERKARWLIP